MSSLREAAQALGVALSDATPHEPEPVPLWRDLAPVVRVFDAVRTQWIMGPAGPVGLLHSAAERPMREQRLHRPRRQRQAWADLRTMEGAALEWFSRKLKR